jgi:hypothetical protein
MYSYLQLLGNLDQSRTEEYNLLKSLMGYAIEDLKCLDRESYLDETAVFKEVRTSLNASRAGFTVRRAKDGENEVTIAEYAGNKAIEGKETSQGSEKTGSQRRQRWTGTRC